MSDHFEPAFPCHLIDFQPETGIQVVREQSSGITKREYFAAKAMSALIAHHGEGHFMNVDLSAIAFRIADAMIEQGEK